MREVVTHPDEEAIESRMDPLDRRFRAVTEHAPVGIFLADANGNCTFVNRRWQEMAGLTDEEARGTGWIRAIHPDDRERLIAEWDAAAREGRECASEYRLRTPAGTVTWVHGRAVPLRDEHGRVTEYLGCLTDITERREAEIALRESEERFRRVQEASPEGFALLQVIRGPTGRVDDLLVTYVNQAATRITGHDLDGRLATELYPNLRESRIWEAYARVAEGGPSEVIEFSYRNDGLETWYRVLVVKVGRDELAIMFSDVTARVESAAAERQARDDAEQMALRLVRLQTVTAELAKAVTTEQIAEVVVNHSVAERGAKAGAVYLVEPEGTHARLLGTPHYCEADSSYFSRLALDDPTPLADVVRTGEPVIVETREEYARRYPISELRTRDLPIAAGAFVCFPLLIDQKPIGVLVLAFAGARRVEHYERTLGELLARHCAQAFERVRLLDAERAARGRAEQAARQADEASRLKEEFLATVSHELRTPLSAILGWATLLKSALKDDPATIGRGLDVIERNARSQLRIIEDILDVSRIIRGEIRIEIEPVDLDRIGRDVLESVRPSASAKDIELIHESSDEPRRLVGDSERLRQILWNLLSNAVKFTKSGGKIWLSIAPVGGKMVLSVRDTGRGIDPGFVPHVFERFRQADGSTTRSSGGLGLGLAIVRHLAEMHGGTVTAASEGLDKGATFTVTLPVQAFSAPVGPASIAASGPAPAAPAALPLQGVLAGTRVLVVEDEEDARELIEILLSGAGAVVKTTSSAEDAMGELADFDPQVLVSDIGMPGRDGYWLVEAVRRRRPGLPTIALTAFSRSEDERRARTAGFDHHLGKPVDPDRLVEIVASYRSGA